MAFKKLEDYTTEERYEGKEEARMFLAYRKAMSKRLFNLLTFCKPTDIDPAGVDGAMLVKISYIEGLTGAKARKLGVEGEPLNVVRKSETVEMEIINSTFTLDRQQIKSSKELPAVINDNMNDATLSVADEILLRFFKAKKANGDKFNGLDYYFEDGNALSGMQIKTVLNLAEGVVDSKTALQFGTLLRKAINGMGQNKPNVLVTTTQGLELIQAYNQVTNIGNKYITVGDQEYTDFMGIKTCDMPNEYFSDESIADNKIPFTFLRSTKDKTGVVICTPNGEVFDPLVPDMSKHDGRVYEGSNESVCVPIPLTVECASRCFVTVGAE